LGPKTRDRKYATTAGWKGGSGLRGFEWEGGRGRKRSDPVGTDVNANGKEPTNSCGRRSSKAKRAG